MEKHRWPHVRRWIWLLALLAVMPAGLLGMAGAAPLIAADAGCTEIIQPEVTQINGLTDHAQTKPGDVLCLPAGTRQNIQVKNLHGSPGSPITIRNSGGNVFITGTLYANGGIGIQNSSYLRVTGSGVSEKCGAEYSPSAQECGIEIGFTNKGIRLVTQVGEQVDHIEIDHVYIHDPSNPITPTDARGIIVHPVSGQLVVGFSAHHNYVLRTAGEGIYIGSEPHGEPLDSLGRLEDVEASYNLIEQTGYDGIKVKVVLKNVKIHHNIVRGAALSHTPQHDAGIQIALSVGEYYNNYVETELEGIAMGRILDSPETKYYNNVVVGADVCLTAPEAGAQLYNNTLVGCGTVGISAPGVGSRVFDNIVAGTKATPIDAPAANTGANLIASTASMHFVNSAAGDYHLLAISGAVDAGGSAGFFPAFDYDDNARPFGPKSDLGAYECKCISALQEKLFLPLLNR